MATNIFTAAKALRKKHPGKAWQELVSMAAGSKSSSKNSNMTHKKRKSTGRKHATTKRPHRRVSGITTTKTRTKRRSVSGVIDKTITGIAIGMAAESIVQQMVIKPLRAKIGAKLPPVVNMLIDPAIGILAYRVSSKAKSPMVKGLALGIMKTSVDNTISTLRGKLGGGGLLNAPALSGYGDQFIQLPMPNMGEIPQYLGEIPQNIGENGSQVMMSNMPSMGDLPQDMPYLPLGWDK